MNQCAYLSAARRQAALTPLGILASAALLWFSAGCGGLPASVEGVVTLDGRPLPSARIAFHPDAKAPVAYGVSLDDGSYTLKTGARQSGLEPSTYRVTVIAVDVPEGPEGDGKLLTPKLYGDPKKTPLRVQVAKGPNRIPLALESSATASGGTASP